MSARDLAFQVLAELLVDNRPKELDLAADCIVPQADEISDQFYGAMLQQPETARFLNHEIVNSRLRSALMLWIRAWFGSRTREQLEAVVERQKQIGVVHARVHVPMHLVSHGIRFLRHDFSRRIVAGVHEKALVRAASTVSDLLDYFIPVTVSVGVAVSDGHPDFNRLLLRADSAMYAAKQQGRNRCVLADTNQSSL